MARKEKNKTFAEKLYKLNRLTGASRLPLSPVDVVNEKLDNPPFEDEEKGSE